MRLCRIGETDLYASWSAILSLFLLLLLYPLKNTIYALLALLLHETAHILAAKHLGYTVFELHLLPFGASMRIEERNGWSRAPVWIALAAPASNLIASGMTALTLFFLPQTHQDLQAFLIANLCIGAWNLLPVYPLDGGRALQWILEHRIPLRTAGIVLKTVAVSVAVLLVTACSYSVIRLHYDPGLALCAFGILLMSLICKPKQDRSAADRLLEHRTELQKRRMLPIRSVLIRSTEPIHSALSILTRDHYQLLWVVDERNNRLGVMDEEELFAAMGRYGVDIPLGTALKVQKKGWHCEGDRAILGPSIK